MVPAFVSTMKAQSLSITKEPQGSLMEHIWGCEARPRPVGASISRIGVPLGVLKGSIRDLYTGGPKSYLY